MFRSAIALVLFLVGSSSAVAETVSCRVATAKPGSVFELYVGATAIVDLENGNTSMKYANVAETPTDLFIVTDTFVSNFFAPRSACKYAREIIMRGELMRSATFKFNSCMHRLPNGTPGYARAETHIELLDKTGHYREIFLTPTGPVPTASATFEDCDSVSHSR